VYKDSAFAAQCRRDLIIRRLQPIDRDLIRLYGARQGRIWAGGAASFLFFALAVEIFCGARYSSYLLIADWVVMVLAYIIANAVARWRLTREPWLSSSGDVFTDLARLEHRAPPELALHAAHRLEFLSFALPIAALTLMLPLTIHFLVGTIFFNVPIYRFNTWILISLVLVGHAHLTLLILSVMHVKRIRSELDRGVPPAGISRGFWALLWTVTTSTIPGAVLLCIPPILVALTGLLFIPWIFNWVARKAWMERVRLEANGLAAPARDA
jgi:hypothetical protein